VVKRNDGQLAEEVSMTAMKWRGKTVEVASVVGVVGLLSVLSSGFEGRAQAPDRDKRVPIPAPVVDARGLMGLFNKPLFEDLKDAMKGEPKDDDGWRDIEGMGLEVAEIANLVAIREAKPPHEQWAQLSGNLQEAGIRLARAANKKDWGATDKAYERLVQKCNDCHETRAPGKAPRLKP
jgi:hypothetical protein